MTRRQRWGLGAVAAGSLLVLDLVTASRLQMQQEALPDAATMATPLTNATVSVVRSDCDRLAAPVAPDKAVTLEQVRDMVWQAIELAPTKLGPLPAIIPTDSWVLVKPNMVFIPPQRGSYSLGDITDPRVTQAVLEYVAEFSQARRITLAMGGSWKGVGSPDYSHDGGPSLQDGVAVDGFTTHFGDDYPGFEGSFSDVIADLAAKYPEKTFDTVDFNYDLYPSLEEPTKVPVPVYNGIGGVSADKYYVSNALLNADIVISVPTMKVHDIPGVSLAHKNYVGTQSRVVNGSGGWWNARLHSQPGGPDMVIADLVSYHPPDYAVIGAIWGMEGQGPHISQGGKPIRLNMVVAGKDPVATDAVAATIMGFNPWDIEHLRNSAAKGFGILDMDHITVRGDVIDNVQLTFEKPARQGTGVRHYFGRANRTWLINGVHEGAELERDFLGNEADVRPLEGEAAGGQIWERLHSGADMVDLKNHYYQKLGAYQTNVVAYAFTYLYAEMPQSGFLWIGADDGVKVWLNGEVVAEEPETGSHRLAAYKVPVDLQAGENRLLVKVKNTVSNYGFSVAVVDEDGDTLPQIWYWQDVPTYVAESRGEALPTGFALGQNAPNPFNSSTVIRFALAESGELELAVYNAVGQQVAELVRGFREAGEYRVHWDGRDGDGRPLASGMYVYRLCSGDRAEARRMLLLK